MATIPVVDDLPATMNILVAIPEFDREHLRLLTDTLSKNTGDLRTANARLRAVINIGLELASERDSERLLQNVSMAARDVFGATYVTIGILALNDRTVERVVTSATDAVGSIHAGDPVAGFLGTVVRERRTLRGSNPNGDPARPELLLPHPEARAYLAAPIASPAHVYGWMCLERSDGKTFGEDDEALVTALAAQVGRIYENDHLYAVALRRADELEAEIAGRKPADHAVLEASPQQEKTGELAAASQTMKSEFLASMSHELRTPLTAIIGFSEVLKDGLLGEMTDRQRRFVGDIFSSGTHLLSLINDILDLSKVKAGTMTLDLEPVALGSLVATCVSSIEKKAAGRGIRIDMSAADDLGAMQVDALKVRQIVQKLLSNAVKFSPDGGAVTVRVARIPRREVGRLSGSWVGRSSSAPDSEFAEFLEIRVTDNGLGMTAEGMAHLFKPFSHVDSGLSRTFEGTGLGLVMVRLLTELHGGTVAVESAVGEGSRFIVWLPLRGMTASAAPALLHSDDIAVRKGA